MRVKIGTKLECQRCGKVWYARKEDVRICPQCKSARFDEPKKEVEEGCS